ncbi:MAG: c-type cytochrome, partial [Gemmatimonadetes bacterium]|nr:c-type cytochrome [Gemmatimonadota bacterium]
MRISRVTFILVGCLLSAASATAQQGDVAAARRIATITSVAIDEYALGVDDNGRVVSPAEVEEAESFLEEARRSSAALAPSLRDVTVPALGQLLEGVKAHRPVGELRAILSGWRSALERAVGVALDPMPSASPTLARGAEVFREHCTECHGIHGRGDGFKAARLNPRPANLTLLDSLRSTSPLDFFRKVTVGVSGTEMKGWEDQLSLDDRWAVALYTTALRYTDAARKRGGRVLRDACPECLALVTDLGRTVGLNDDSLRTLLAGRLGSAPDDSALATVVAFARTAPAAGTTGEDRASEVARIVAATEAGVGQAVALADGGDRTGATSAALDAYLVFERIETALRARDPSTAARVEGAFGRLRNALAAGGVSEIATARRQVTEGLSAAERSLTAETSAGMLFGQSLVIMLREGLEAMLIVGALMAFLVKAGAPERRREMGWGVVVAIGASLLTAAVLA